MSYYIFDNYIFVLYICLVILFWVPNTSMPSYLCREWRIGAVDAVWSVCAVDNSQCGMIVVRLPSQPFPSWKETVYTLIGYHYQMLYGT
jgi:hypothetical protein